MKNISGASSKAELEEDELDAVKTGIPIIYPAMDEDSQASAREVVAMAMSMQFNQWLRQVGLQKWKVICSNDTPFILPDSFDLNILRNLHILPVAPQYAMVLESTYNHLEKDYSLNAENINKLLINGSRKYYISID